MEPAADVDVKNDYGILYYKNNSIGIRERFGAQSQIFSFGGLWCTKSEKELRDIAKVIVADLHQGMSAVNAKSKGQRLAGKPE